MLLYKHYEGITPDGGKIKQYIDLDKVMFIKEFNNEIYLFTGFNKNEWVALLKENHPKLVEWINGNTLR